MLEFNPLCLKNTVNFFRADCSTEKKASDILDGCDCELEIFRRKVQCYFGVVSDFACEVVDIFKVISGVETCSSNDCDAFLLKSMISICRAKQ